MTVENLAPTITSSVGGFFIGIILGYFAKKIIKILLFITGGLIALLLYLQQQQIISVNIVKLEKSIAFLLDSFASSFDKTTLLGDSTSFGFPFTGSMTAGFMLGFIRS